MKTIHKILWGFISTVICILYRTDVNAYPYGRKATYNYNGLDVKFSVNTNNVRCTPTRTNNCTAGTPYSKQPLAIQSAIRTATILPNQKCRRNQYVTTCGCSDGTLACCTTDNITCADCPNGGYTQSSAVVYTTTTQALGSWCCHWDSDNTQSYTLFMVMDTNQMIIINSDITDCFRLPATTYKDDPTGLYEFTNSCYYTEQ